MSEKLVVQSPFIVRPMEVAKKGNWDTEYVDYEHKQVVKKIGDGDEDYVIVTKHIEKRTPIEEVVERDRGTCSVKDIMRRFIETGDASVLPQPMAKDGITNDYTKVPDNLMDLDNYSKSMELKFNQLPDSLKKGRTFAEFAETINSQEFVQFMAMMMPKKEEKKDGDK